MRVWLGVLASSFVVAFTTGVTPAQAQSDSVKERLEQCKKGDHQACEQAGNSLKLGMSQPKDLKGAREAFDLGCKGDDFAGLGACVSLYRMVSLGEGGPKDPARAAELEKRACNTRILSYEAYLEEAGLCKK